MRRRIQWTDTIPAGEAQELTAADALRALFDEFGVLDCPATEPMPLALAPSHEHDERKAWHDTLAPARDLSDMADLDDLTDVWESKQ